MEEERMLEHKRRHKDLHDRETPDVFSPKKFKHKPYKFMSNAEKKRLMDKEAWKDHVRLVII